MMDPGGGVSDSYQTLQEPNAGGSGGGPAGAKGVYAGAAEPAGTLLAPEQREPRDEEGQ